MFEAELHPVEDFPRQLSAMMPNRIVEWPQPSAAGPKHIRRMREPYHSILLDVASAQSPLFDDTAMIVIDKTRGLIIET
jgi:hypothetical protein